VGFFGNIGKSINQAFGAADSELLTNGTLGRGQILSAVPSGGTVQVMGGLVERTCTFQVKVLLDGQTPYIAGAQQRVPEVYLAQFQSGAATVAVRVDPAQPLRIALDLKTPAPSVRLGRNSGPGSAEHILETGTDATVVMISSADAGYQDYRGYEMYVFVLTVATGAPQPYQVQAGNAVPPESLPLLYPGSKLYAKIGSDPNQVVVDFSRGAAS
jgi:hypothetical protein